MPGNPIRAVTLRNVVGMLLTLVGVWAVVATSSDDPGIVSEEFSGSVDVAAGSTARLVFDVLPDDAALATETDLEFSIEFFERSADGLASGIRGGIVGHVETTQIESNSSLRCVCGGAQLVVELQLPAEAAAPFTTVVWSARASIAVNNSQSDAGSIELTLTEVEETALLEAATGSQPRTEFTGLALEVEVQGDDQLWIQTTDRYDSSVMLVAPDGKRIEIQGEETRPMECETGSCSGRFTLLTPMNRTGSDFSWRVIASSERSVVTQQPLRVRSTVQQVADLDLISLDRDNPLNIDVRVEGTASAPAVEGFLLIEVGFTGTAADQARAASPQQGSSRSFAANGFGSFVPLADGAITGSADFAVSTFSNTTIEVNPFVTATLFWVPIDPAVVDGPALTVTAEVTG